MSSLFKDPYFESMDPISKMIEPFTCPVFEVAQKSPKIYKVSFEKLKKYLIEKTRVSYVSARCERVFSPREIMADLTDFKECLNAFDKLVGIDPAHFVYYSDAWKMEMPCDEMEFFLGEDDQSTYGDIIFSLNEELLNQDVVKKWFVDRLVSDIVYCQYDKKQLKILLKYLSLTKRDIGINLSSVSEFARHVRELLETDKWRVRSSTALIDLADAFVSVLSSRQGWGEKLTNLTHFKILTHSGSPIYSFPGAKT